MTAALRAPRWPGTVLAEGVAMEIVRRGVRPEDREHTGTCGRCGTVVRFREDEARVSYEPDRAERKAAVACPLCLRSIAVVLSADAAVSGADHV